MTKGPLEVDCPACGRAVPWAPESLFRPFCSERCRMVDLGSWAAEAYTIEGPTLHEDSQAFDGSAQDPS